MRIAIPVTGGVVSPTLDACEAIKFYEDDHGRIVRRFLVPAEGGGADAVLALLERYGIDALVCAPLGPEEQRTFAASGLLLSPNASGDADAAALAYLGGAIAFDPANTCDYCGHRHECSMDCVEKG